jgi:flagellar hook-length control protein FliK
MLKEADQAEIRLIIRPPELGRVRINMHMENGHIAGKILVDNGSVREAVEQNLAALQRAFEEAGLEVGDFEVSTGDSRDEAADDRATPSHSGANRRRNGAGQFAESVEPVVVNDYSHRRINLVA